jgi:hypothetical protein
MVQANQVAKYGVVYVKEVATQDLPKEIREKLASQNKVYAVHSEAGERLALVRDRKLAFILARQNDLTPVTVH